MGRRVKKQGSRPVVRVNQSRAPRASESSVGNRSFIIDLVKPNGRRFVTSVSNRDAVRPKFAALKGQSATVSHWEQVRYCSDHPMDGWQLVERFSL